jgi:hypothetical protein
VTSNGVAAGVHPHPAAGVRGEAGGLARGRAGQVDGRGGRLQWLSSSGAGGARPGRRGAQVHVPVGERGCGELAGPRQQPVAGHPLRQRGGHRGACLVGVGAQKCQICRQRVGVDQLPPVREYGDVPVGQRCPRADRDPRQPRVNPERVPFGIGAGAGYRRHSSEGQQIRERRAQRRQPPRRRGGPCQSAATPQAWPRR